VAVAVGAAPAAIIDDAESGALALEGVLESVEAALLALLPESLESAVHENIPSAASRLTVNAATA
jgi:hypothetical protein